MQDARGQVAEGETRGAFGIARFEHGAAFVEAREVAGEFVEIIAEEVRTAFLGDGFEHEAEVGSAQFEKALCIHLQ